MRRPCLPGRQASAALIAAALASLLGPFAKPAAAQFPPDLHAALDDALALYRRNRAEQHRLATDPNERYEVLVGRGIFAFGDADYIFNLGDEAFEAEIDRPRGLGQGEAWGPEPLPAYNRRLHDGERGGLDASSCRVCHFVGGPDGAGAPTQFALLRGDGERLSTATVRDAPHLMGLGYIAIAARHIERQINLRVDVARSQARDLGEPVSAWLLIDDIDYGRVTAHPDGRLDPSQVRGLSPDLIVRPFGHKGRHATLEALADEALALHHGLQSDARIDDHQHAPAIYLGDGDRFDPDADGVQSEVDSAQAVLLAAYLSMLGTPRIRPPDDPALALVAARGRALFEATGCAECHRPALYLPDLVTTLHSGGAEPFAVEYDLAEAGQEPRPYRLDFTPDANGQIRGGIPIFAFTDLRRHDLGPELAEPRPEVLPGFRPGGGGEVPGAVWLTRSLWGLADTGPYLHDGRAPTVHDAIMAHGGDAAPSRDAYRALDGEARGALGVFLMTLTRPPFLLVE